MPFRIYSNRWSFLVRTPLPTPSAIDGHFFAKLDPISSTIMRDWHLSSLAYGFKRVYWAVCASVFQNFKCPTKTEITNKTLMRLACARADTFQNLSIFQIGTSLSKCRAAYGAQVLLLQTQTQKQQQTNPSPNPQTYSAPQTVGLVLGCVDRRFNNVDRNLSAIFVIERLMYVGQKKSRFEMRLV